MLEINLTSIIDFKTQNRKIKKKTEGLVLGRRPVRRPAVLLLLEVTIPDVVNLGQSPSLSDSIM